MALDVVHQPLDPAHLAAELQGRRAVFIGPTGAGKSTLVAAIADELPAGSHAVCADPGSPGFGAPTTISLARRSNTAWHIVDFEAVASLDAGKYRLSILGAVDRLVGPLGDASLLIDAPGLHRGGLAREFIQQLISVTRADVAVYLVDNLDDAELLPAVRASGADVWHVEPSPDAASPSKGARRRARTEDWEAFLDDASALNLSRERVTFVADMPARDEDLVGRTVGLGGDDGQTLSAGEILEVDQDTITVETHVTSPTSVRSILIRDAGRGPDGLLRTVRDQTESEQPGVVEIGRRTPFTLRKRSSAAGISEPQTVRIGLFEASMLGGPFDDPSVYISLLHHERGMLVDLGESWRLPTRLHHQLSDIFITHAHVDHFAGFVDVLRRRVHVREPCRIWGPRGIARRVEAMVDAFTWDRIEEDGPVFEIAEFHGDEIQSFRVEAGVTSLEAVGVEPAGGPLVDEPRFRVHTKILEHGTDSLAFRFEETQHFDVRSDRLVPPFEPGPWLGELKRLAAIGDDEDVLTMSDGSKHTVAALRDRLLLERPGQSIVYASDLADTSENRARLVELADGADLLICEAYFAREDEDKARSSRHLTADGCAEIAAEAGVGNLLPFHFSARYGDQPELIYDQIRQTYDDVILPRWLIQRRSG